MLSTRNQSIAYEKQSKFIQDRITSVEKYFSELCSAFALYARKVARLRDAGDEVSKNLKIYSDNEDVNKSLSAALAEVSTTFYAIEEYRNARCQRLEVKIVGELSQYEGICKHFRGEIKHILALRDSEMNRKKNLDKIKEKNPMNRQQIMHAEVELIKATTDMNRTAKELEDQTDTFEKQKLLNIKSILKTFIEIEMSFHAKALELYTIAYQQINNIDCESDLYVFQETKGSFDMDYRTQMQNMDGQSNSQRSTGFGSMASLLGQEKPLKTSTPNDTETSNTSEESSQE